MANFKKISTPHQCSSLINLPKHFPSCLTSRQTRAEPLQKESACDGLEKRFLRHVKRLASMVVILLVSVVLHRRSVGTGAAAAAVAAAVEETALAKGRGHISPWFYGLLSWAKQIELHTDIQARQL